MRFAFAAFHVWRRAEDELIQDTVHELLSAANRSHTVVAFAIVAAGSQAKFDDWLAENADSCYETFKNAPADRRRRAFEELYDSGPIAARHLLPRAIKEKIKALSLELAGLAGLDALSKEVLSELLSFPDLLPTEKAWIKDALSRKRP